MMNFLPTEDKIFIKKEYLRRIFMTSGVFIFSILLISSLLLFLWFLSFQDQRGSFERNFILSQEKLSESNFGETEPIIKDMQMKISLLQGWQNKEKDKSSIMADMVGKKPSAIKITSILFEKGKILVRGKSTARSDLINFLYDLKTEKMFKNVDSPISNLIKEKDIDFDIIINL